MSSRIPHGNTSGAEHEQPLPVPGLLGVGIASDAVAGALVEGFVDCGHGCGCVDGCVLGERAQCYLHLSLSQGGKKLGHMQKHVSARVGPLGGEGDAEGGQKRRSAEAAKRRIVRFERGDAFSMASIASNWPRTRDRMDAGGNVGYPRK